MTRPSIDSTCLSRVLLFTEWQTFLLRWGAISSRSRRPAPDVASDSGNVLQTECEAFFFFLLMNPAVHFHRSRRRASPRLHWRRHVSVCYALMFKCVNIWYGNNNLCSMNKLLLLNCSVSTSRLHNIWRFRFKHTLVFWEGNSCAPVPDCETLQDYQCSLCT